MSMSNVKRKYMELHSAFLAKIDECMNTSLPELEKIQNCFWASVKFAELLKEQALANGFEDEAAEIEFFREIKPEFLSYLEFFVMAFEALSYGSSGAQDLSTFWNGEMERFGRFYNKNQTFISYYHSGRRDLDKEYFLRTSVAYHGGFHANMYNEGPAFHSAKDWVIAAYFANKMFFGFAKDKLMSYSKQDLTFIDLDEHTSTTINSGIQ